MAWLGTVRYGAVLHGKVRFGGARHGGDDPLFCGMVRLC